MKYRKRSRQSIPKRPRRKSCRLKVAMSLLALIVSTGCTSIPTEAPPDPYRGLLVSMFPEVPTPPSLPALQWSFECGKYCIDEADADKLLDYGENELPLFAHHLEQYQRKVKTILDAIAGPRQD